MTEPLTPETLAELREEALMSRCYSGGRAVGIAPDELIALLDAAGRLVYVESEKDALIGSVLHYKAERDELAATVERVRALHQPCRCGSGNAHCDVCETLRYPCPTIRALAGSDQGEDVAP